MGVNRKQLKSEAWKTLKKNYFWVVFAAFAFSLIMNGGYNYSSGAWYGNSSVIQFYQSAKTVIQEGPREIEAETLGKTELNDSEQAIDEQARGVLAPIVSVISNGNFLGVNFLNSIRLIFLEGNLSAGLISLAAALIALFEFILIKMIFEIGKNRYFLETRQYRKTNVGRMAFPYRTRKMFKLAWTMFLKNLFTILWSLTIVGGFVKRYQYLLIPYILAENPTISTREAFRLSKEMMRGRKFEAFKLELTFLPWVVLAIFTFGVSDLFFFDPFRELVWANFYAETRKETKKTLQNGRLLDDEYLFRNTQNLPEYPEKKYPHKLRSFAFKTDYDRNYSVRNLILFFFTFAFVGWIWEVMLSFATDGKFINRGTMFGPWLPIYGTGGVAILVLLKKLRKKPGFFFLAAMALAGVIEYGTAWYLETVKGMKWWDYTGFFLNIDGRICLEGLLVFGLGGAAVTYFLAPILDEIYNKMRPKTAGILCTCLLAAFGTDFVYSLQHPNTGEGITTVQE